MRSIILAILIVLSPSLYAQIGIGTTAPNASSILELKSTSKGFIGPVLSESQKQNISSPATGLMIYNSNEGVNQHYDGSGWKSFKKRITKIVDAGDTVTFGNLMVKLPTSGNRSLQIAFISGTNDVSGTSINHTYSATASSSGAAGSISSWVKQSDVVSSTFQYWQSSYNLDYRGNIQEIFMIDETNEVAYRIKVIAGGSYNNNSIEIEILN